MIKLAVLASGSGTNVQALIDARANESLDADIVAVITDNSQAGAIRRAQLAGIPVHVVTKESTETRTDFDSRLADTVVATGAELVVLAGFMRLLSMQFLSHFPMRVINLHPALPGELPGVRAIERAFEERDAVGRTTSGVMVHFVPDEGVDDGPVIAAREVPIHADDTLDAFSARMHDTEHELLVVAVQSVIDSLSHYPIQPEELTP
jgi:formyltetrahydrofolate-dependent phosphoribosylglycinamide formyltransferase